MIDSGNLFRRDISDKEHVLCEDSIRVKGGLPDHHEPIYSSHYHFDVGRYVGNWIKTKHLKLSTDMNVSKNKFYGDLLLETD